MAREMLRLKKLHDELTEMTGFPIFGVDIGKDEIDSNDSFFIFYENGSIRKDTESVNLLRDFILMYITKKAEPIDEYAIISKSNTWGLRFRNTEYDFGKIGDSQEIVHTTTFYFQQVVRMCDEIRN